MAETEKTFKLWKNMFSSLASSISIKTALAPIERVKIFMQTDINNRRLLASTHGKEIVTYKDLVKVSSSKTRALDKSIKYHMIYKHTINAAF